MHKDTKRQIEAYKAMLPGLKERIIAVALMLAMSVAMMASASYAWLTISRAPEATGMSTTVTGNGNLEIALVSPDGALPGSANGSEASLQETNITWGNLVNLSDSGYGLEKIILRPSLLSQYNLTTSPLYGATYGDDGRVSGTSDKYSFATLVTAEDGTQYFAATTAADPAYGIRAITSITYENVTGNAALNALSTKISNAYGNALEGYKSLIMNETVIYGEGSAGMRSLTALQMLMELYVQEKAQNLLGSYTQDYSGVVTYAYHLLAAFKDVLEAEGEALTSLANMQIYKTNNALGTGFYTDFNAFYEAYTNDDLHEAVDLDSLTSFFTNYNDMVAVLGPEEEDTPEEEKSELRKLAEACDPNTVSASNRPQVTWVQLSPYVNKLAKISTVTIQHGSSKVTIGKLTAGDAGALLSLAGSAVETNPATATIYEGALRDTEARLGAMLRETGVVVCINVNYMGVGDVYAYVVTDVDPQQLTISGADQAAAENMTNEGASDQGDAVAKDTYGMAIDLWLRTNVSGMVLTLEGNLNTTEVDATTINKDGVETILYKMTLTTRTTSTVYGLQTGDGTTYYSYEDGVMSEIGTNDSMNMLLGYSFAATGNTETVEDVTYTEYTMTLSQNSVEDVYVIKNTERWYSTDGVLIGAAETLANDTRYSFAETDDTMTVDGKEVVVYTLTYTDPNTPDEPETIQAYRIAEDLWYKADNHEVLGTDAELKENGAVFEKKTEVWVTGYDGVNRVWEDFMDLIEDELMLENNTTQGSGSCYVFYADPSDQSRILNLLEAFTVVFMDREGNKLGTAKLDTEHTYSINGKTTVPLKMIAGTAYTDEDGNQQIGITAMEKNEATWITAVVYLDGQRLTNEDVLAVGEMEGTLNVQFGSSIPLENQDDIALRFEFRDLTAEAIYNGKTSSSSDQAIELDYNPDGHNIDVYLNLEGTQPRSIQGFFVRSISESQGTKCQTVPFALDSETGKWKATFTLTTPGTYIMRSLIVDGAEYALDDGTDNPDDEGNIHNSFPTVKISGLGIASVRVDGLNNGITMTADRSVAAEVTVGIDADPSLMPSRVRALFRSKTGQEFTALLYNMGAGGSGTASLWKGTANITESGEYTLQYVVMDNVYFDLDEVWQKQAAENPEEGQFTYIIYLGLTSQVWSQGVPVQDEEGNPVQDEEGNITYTTEFEYHGAQNINYQVKIYDASGAEIRAMDDVWLYYHSEGSVLDQDGMYGQIYWNASTGYYEGTLQVSAGGVFVFDRVVTNRSNTNSVSTISRAVSAPTITAIVTEPPVYQGKDTKAYQFVPNGGATMSVVLENAQTASLWALITDGEDTYMVPMAAKENYIDAYRFTFNVPADATQDGQWQMISLYLQGCADGNENWVPKTASPVTEGFIKLSSATITVEDEEGNTSEVPGWEVAGSDATVNPANYFIFDLTDASVNGNDPVETYVVQTVYVSVNGADKVESGKVEFGNVLYGVDDTDNDGVKDDGETINGIFMQTHTYSPEGAGITFVITDWNDQILDAVINWTSTYGKDSATYGGYTRDYEVYPFEDVKSTLTLSNGTHTLKPQTYQQAGTYTTQFAITIDGVTLPIITGDAITVYSKAPTVTISGVSANPTDARYYLTSTPNSLNVITGSFNNKIDDYNAVVYMYVAAQSGTLDQEQVTIKYPTVTLNIAGLPSAHGGVTMVFPSGNNTSSTFTFAAGNTTATSTIGAGTDGVFNEGLLGLGASVEKWPVFYPAGKQTVQTVVVTYGDAQYTVTLSNAVTINNPQYPPYVSFEVNDSTFNSSNLPGRVYSTDGETVTLTLPSVSSWSYTQTDNVPGTETLTSDTTDDVYTATSASLGRSKYTYYNRNIKVYTSTGTSTSYLVTKEIVGWKVNGVEYKPGDTITVTGTQTITAVVKTTNGAKTVQTTTVTRTVTTFTATGETSTGWSPKKGSKVTSVENTETTTSTTN